MGEVECGDDGQQKEGDGSVELKGEMGYRRALGLVVGSHDGEFVLAGGEDDEHLDIGIEDVEEGVVGRGEDAGEEQVGEERDGLGGDVARRQGRRFAEERGLEYVQFRNHIVPLYLRRNHSAVSRSSRSASTQGSASSSEKRVWV